MSRLKIWAFISIGGFAYWGVVNDFANGSIHDFVGPFWYGGISLFCHWLLESDKQHKGEA